MSSDEYQTPPRSKSRSAADSDWELSDFSSDDDRAEYGKKSNKRDRTYTDKKRLKSRRRPPPLQAVRPTIKMEQLDPGDFTLSPSGQHCRFIPYEDIVDRILQSELYLEPGEKGFNTFLPGFSPMGTDHLEYFGFKKELEKVDLAQIQAVTEEEIEKLLIEVEAELLRFPPPTKKSAVCIPGFSTNLHNSIAINADVRTFDWGRLGSCQQFDVILMDPPWMLGVKDKVTRGVSLQYDQLDITDISAMPLHCIQNSGYVFMWVIASQFTNGISLLKKWGYKIISYLNWVKISKYGRYQPSHGYYMQHDKETLLIGHKGGHNPEMNKEAFQSLIVSQRDIRQSQKPIILYEMIEEIFPGQLYLEIFARPHNLRDGWVSIGIELPT